MKCYAPWHAMCIRFNGDVVPDCVYTGRHGNLLEDTLPDIFKDIGLQKTRDTIKSGVLPLNCSQCTKKEAAGGHSRRKFFETTLNPYLEEYDYSIPVNKIYFLEFNMSNVCNLKCRMCSGVNSTGWIKEDRKLSSNKNFKRPVNHPEFGYRTLNPSIIDNLFSYPEYFEHLQYVNIKGGEPYLEPANKEILRRLINMGVAKNITLDISTNGTIIDREFDDLALQFKETKWHISIEGTGKLYEYIRGGKNFKFEQMEENIKEFSKFDRVIFAGTVMPYNVCHLKDIEEWFNKIKKPNYELYTSNVVTTPAYLNPTLLPDTILKDTPFVHNPELAEQVQTFIDYTRHVDKLRSTNVLDVCPELAELFS